MRRNLVKKLRGKIAKLRSAETGEDVTLTPDTEAKSQKSLNSQNQEIMDTKEKHIIEPGTDGQHLFPYTDTTV